MQRFGHIDELAGVALQVGGVELADVAHTYDVVEFHIGREGVEHLVLVDYRGHLCGIGAVEGPQKCAVAEGCQREHPDVARVGSQTAVVAVGHVAQAVVDAVERVDAFEQLHLVVESGAAEDFYHLGARTFVAYEG